MVMDCFAYSRRQYTTGLIPRSEMPCYMYKIFSSPPPRPFHCLSAAQYGNIVEYFHTVQNGKDMARAPKSDTKSAPL